MDVAIVGGSLTGLTFALACAHQGLQTLVLERVSGRHHGGGALAIDRTLLLRVIGLETRDDDRVASFPVLTPHRQAIAWHEIHRWLLELARRKREITLRSGVTISEVVQDDTSATAITVDGERIEARMIVGADGYRSVVRRSVNPARPTAVYAGYVLWRGLIREADLPVNTRWSLDNDGIALMTRTGYRLIAYPVAGPGGSLAPGERLISFAWYDPTRTTLLRERRCLSSTQQVLASLPPGSVPRSVCDELRALARRIWPEPWCTAITHALEHGEVFATPVAEYFPERLCCGRFAILGDAAHVVSPVVGQGFEAGILDAEALADALAESLHQNKGDQLSALKIYEQKRLTSVQELVASSRRWSQAYLNGERDPSSPILAQKNSDAKQLLYRTREKSGK